MDIVREREREMMRRRRIERLERLDYPEVGNERGASAGASVRPRGRDGRPVSVRKQ